ncbi:ABC transporter substrate-binding protein [Paenibacillus contaminans]|uniref:Sugar ABC transporter substrate-binding protein n=1 Tax=Paenibacillus contaminans TaxID=450362 RepID=A0A329MMF4_9BACL|nr:sugar ABC transporter substrate-binding protein [Paenibacillus contaminans]RAV20790.1 sugar ABC transporter substrate-binding protein [Paenibacillus contaminans]
MDKLKKPAAVLLGLAMTVGLSACGTSNDSAKSSTAPGANSSSPTPAAKKEKTKLVYWTFQRHDADFIQEKIKKFNESNKENIEVEMTMMAENYAQSLDLAFTSNQAPDVFGTFTPAEFSAKGYFEPLNKYMTDNIKKKFDGMFNENDNMFNGNIISFPNSGATLRLIYNVDIFEKAGVKPPKSLDELVETAKKITEVGKKDGIYGWSLPYKSPASALNRSLMPMAALNGMSDGYDYKAGKFDYSGWKPLIEALRKMKTDGSTLPGSESLDMDPMRAQFAEGKIGMYISYSVEPGVYKNQFPPKIKWDAAPMPTIDGGEPKGTAGPGGGIWLSMSSKSKNKDAAWKFMEYMYSDEMQTAYHELGYGLSVVPSISKAAKEPNIPGIKNFLLTKYDANWPLSPQGLKLEGKTWQEEFGGYILVGGDLDKIIQSVNDRYNSALEKGAAAGTTKKVVIPNFDSKSLQGK